MISFEPVAGNVDESLYALQTGHTKPRSAVHRDGDWHRALHVWILCLETGELVLQRRAASKDAWAGLLDISTAGTPQRCF